MGKWSNTTGAQGLWPTSLKNLRHLAKGEGFSWYFHDLFNGNEASYLRWKEVFNVLGIVGVREGRGSLEALVLAITESEDLVKLRALAKLCSREFLDDPALLVTVRRRILEVLEADEEGGGETKGEEGEGEEEMKLEVLDACYELGKACNLVRNYEDAKRYYKRTKEGYEEQLGPDSEKALEATFHLIMSTRMSHGERIEKLRVLVGRMVGALGEENVVTLETLNSLGVVLKDNGEYEEARKVYERCLAGRVKELGENHKDTLMTVNNLGNVYTKLEDNEKALEYYERALKGSEKMLGKTHPETLGTVMNIATVYDDGLKDFGKAEELYKRALEGYEAQLGKDHQHTKDCAWNFADLLKKSGNSAGLEALKEAHPNVEDY